jgi:hypothetical protein
MHLSVPLYLIPDSPPELDTESDSVPWTEDSSSEGIDYVPVGLEIEMPRLKDSEGDEVQILEPSLSPWWILSWRMRKMVRRWRFWNPHLSLL